jgi:membrane dipeptidase
MSGRLSDEEGAKPSSAASGMGLDRRRLVFLAAGLGAFALARRNLAFGLAEPASFVPGLYRRSIVIDGLAEAFDPSGSLPLEGRDLASIASSGLTAINFTVVGPGADFEAAVRAIAFVEAAAEAYPERLALVRRHADIARAKREGRLGLILGFQTTEMLGGDLSRIEVFRRLGVRIMQLTYNDRNLFGDGCLEPANAGLSRLGREAVARMNAAGVAVDLSHSGDRTTSEAIVVSSRPVLITHTGCRAVFDNPRNKEDRELRALADRGGVVGIYLMPFLSGGPGPLSQDDLLRHLHHALQVCGEDHVGIGSDQGITPIDDTPEYRKRLREEVEDRRRAGVSAPGESPDRPPFIPELNRPDRLERIAEGLARRGYGESVIAKVIGANFDRVLGEIWGA